MLAHWDTSAAALDVATENAHRLRLGNVRFARSNWYDHIGNDEGRFDIIVANPPYIAANDPHLREGDLRFEPRGALTPGGDGLAALRTIIEGASSRLANCGALLVEHGYNQSAVVRECFAQRGFVDIERRRDLAGHWRVVSGRSASANDAD